jgi:hypothetical protein
MSDCLRRPLCVSPTRTVATGDLSTPATAVEVNFVIGQMVIIPNHAPLPIPPVFVDKLDTYTHRSKSGAAGAIPNVVGIASLKEHCCRRRPT